MELRSAELEVAGIGMSEFQEKKNKWQETAMPIANRSLLDKKSKKRDNSRAVPRPEEYGSIEKMTCSSADS